jgi:hypothetical protein
MLVRDRGYTALMVLGTFGIREALLGLLGLMAGCSGGAPPVIAPAVEVPVIDASPADGMVPARGAVRFGRIPPAVGARWHVTTEARSTLVDARQSMLGQVYTSSYTVEVLATNGQAPSRVRLSFEKNHYVTNGAETPTALEGNTYLLEMSSPLVRDASGAAVSASEAERILDIFPELGTRTQIDQVLPDGPMAIGDDRRELAAAVLSVIHPRGWVLIAGSATLTNVDDSAAYFTTTIDATAKATGIRMWIKGDVRVRLYDAQLMGVLLSGTYALSSTVDPTADPEGTITIRRVTHEM